jgi:hypothetical protein
MQARVYYYYFYFYYNNAYNDNINVSECELKSNTESSLFLRLVCENCRSFLCCGGLNAINVIV